MRIEDCFKVGYIAKPHGLKGEVTVVFSDSIPVRKSASILVEINGSLVPYFIQQISDRGDKAFIKLEEIETVDQAKALQGRSLYMQKKDRPDLQKGQFYDDEVIGFEVSDVSLGVLGKVREILQIGSNRLLAINHDPREILIPVGGPFIQSINRSKKKVTVDLPGGFLDI